jgi:GDP-D-mannose 3', 5'-epimerase
MIRTQNKAALVLGAGGFIGNHLVNKLKSEDYWVTGVDLKRPDFSETKADEFITGNLTDYRFVDRIINNNVYYENVPLQYADQYDEIYQLAADMGGAGYIFTGEHDADIMTNSAAININLIKAVNSLNKLVKTDWFINKRVAPYTPKNTKIFYSSSACMYPEYNQCNEYDPNCEESSAYPAKPDSEYGWEKLFSERLFLAANRNYDIPVRIARFHNIYGPEGTYDGGREKAPAALCRKYATNIGQPIDIWGDGRQTRSFLYISECIEGIRRLMNSDFTGPVNIGSDEMISIRSMADYLEQISGKQPLRIYLTKSSAVGVRGRNSHNTLIREKLNWAPHYPLYNGLEQTYAWIQNEILKKA